MGLQGVPGVFVRACACVRVQREVGEEVFACVCVGVGLQGVPGVCVRACVCVRVRVRREVGERVLQVCVCACVCTRRGRGRSLVRLRHSFDVQRSCDARTTKLQGRPGLTSIGTSAKSADDVREGETCSNWWRKPG